MNIGPNLGLILDRAIHIYLKSLPAICAISIGMIVQSASIQDPHLLYLFLTSLTKSLVAVSFLSSLSGSRERDILILMCWTWCNVFLSLFFWDVSFRVTNFFSHYPLDIFNLFWAVKGGWKGKAGCVLWKKKFISAMQLLQQCPCYECTITDMWLQILSFRTD